MVEFKDVQVLLCTTETAIKTKRKRGKDVGISRHSTAIEQLLQQTKSLLPGTKCVVNLQKLESELDVRKVFFIQLVSI